jgi:hypothetical protein
MTKRRLLRWSLILVIFGAFAVWLEPTRVIWGWLRGEAFYQGRPTSWWRDDLGRMGVRLIGAKMYEVYVQEHEFDSPKFAANYEAATSVKFSRQISRFEQLWAGSWKTAFQPSVTMWKDVDDPPLVAGDHRAAEVLHELTDDPSPKIRFLVRHGLRTSGVEISKRDQ